MKLSLVKAARPLTLVASVSALSALVAIGASCAADETNEAPPDDTSTSVPPPDAGTTTALDASTDATPPCDPDSGTCTTEVLSCDVAAWCPVPTNVSTQYALAAVWGSGPSDVWAVGSGGMTAHWDGAAWKAFETPVKNTFRAVWGTGPTDVWAVAMTDVIFHTTGFSNGNATWTRMDGATSADEAVAATALWGTSAGEVRIGAKTRGFYDPKSGEISRVNQYRKGTTKDGGLAWDPLPGSGTVHGFWGAPNDLWYVADNSDVTDWQKGMTMHGTPEPDAGTLAWKSIDSQSTVVLEAIWGSSPGDLWAVGDKGTIRHYTAGSARWTIVASPTTQPLHAIWGTSANDIWAVGDGGTILHYDGKAWKTSTAAFPLGKKPDLLGVWGSSANDVWIVGETTALHYTGPKPGQGGAP